MVYLDFETWYKEIKTTNQIGLIKLIVKGNNYSATALNEWAPNYWLVYLIGVIGETYDGRKLAY